MMRRIWLGDRGHESGLAAGDPANRQALRRTGTPRGRPSGRILVGREEPTRRARARPPGFAGRFLRPE